MNSLIGIELPMVVAIEYLGQSFIKFRTYRRYAAWAIAGIPFYPNRSRQCFILFDKYEVAVGSGTVIRHEPHADTQKETRKVKNMMTMTNREYIKSEIDTLPDSAIEELLEFIAFQKFRIGMLERGNTTVRGTEEASMSSTGFRDDPDDDMWGHV